MDADTSAAPPPVLLRYADPDRALTRLGANFMAVVLIIGLGTGAVIYLSEPAWLRPGPLFVLGCTGAALAYFCWRAQTRLQMRRVILRNLWLAEKPFAYTGTLADMLRVKEGAAWAHAGLQLAPLLTATPGTIGRTINGLESPVLSTFADYLGLRHRLHHTTYAGYPFSLQGPFRPYFVLRLRRLLWAIISGGYLYAELAVRTRRLLYRHVYWAGHQAHYTGDENEVRSLYLRGAFTCLVTLGFYLPWHLAKLRNYHLSKLSLAGVHVHSFQQGDTLARLMWTNALSLLVTAGLSTGWVLARNVRYQLDHLRLSGHVEAPREGAEVGHEVPDTCGISDLFSRTTFIEH